MEEMSHKTPTPTDMQYLEDLRRRINAKAESMISFSNTKSKKRHWIVIIVGMVFLVVFYAQNSQKYGDDWNYAGQYVRAGVILFVTLLLYFLCIWRLRHHLAAMKSSNSVSLHYQAARRYINISQLVAVIMLTGVVAIIPSIYGEDPRIVAFASCFVLVVLILWRLFKRDMLINKEFYNDVVELEKYV